MYRISVTMLEKFRRYMAQVAPTYDTEEAVIACISGTFEGNDLTKFGHAFHSILEGKYEHLVPQAGAREHKRVVIADGVIFPQDVVQPALDFRAAHPKICFEVPMLPVVFETREQPVLISGRVDAVEALRIRDTKLKFRSIDQREYIDSCQWKFYLHMLEAETFIYDLFEVKGFDGFLAGPTVAADVKIIPYDPIVCQAYPTMETDLQQLVYDFLRFCKAKNLFHLLKEAEPQELPFR
jgi:hypothetical protein